ncbi:MAG: hypothetical protein ABIE94_02710 [archaeon]
MNTLLKLDLEDTPENLAEVQEGVREGNTSARNIKVMQMGEYKQVIYCDLEANTSVDAENLARLAVNSVQKCKDMGKIERNGIRYLLEKIKNGVVGS